MTTHKKRPAQKPHDEPVENPKESSWSDPDSPLVFLGTGVLVLAAVSLSLVCFYNTWETPKDLKTIIVTGSAYFAAAGARLIWIRKGK